MLHLRGGPADGRAASEHSLTSKDRAGSGRGANKHAGFARSRRERGAAVTEFVLVLVVLCTLFLAVLQVGFVIHVRNTLVASAAEGARYAANANRGLGDGEARTRALIGQSLSPDLARDVQAQLVNIGGVPTVEVTVTTTLPLAGLLGVDRGLTVHGHAVAEPGL